jgi:hypothetical protein
MPLKDRVENHPVVFFFGVFLFGYGCGFASSEVLEVPDHQARPGNSSSEERTSEVEVQSFVIDCSGTSKFCEQYLNLTVPTREELKIRYYVGDIQCQSVRLHFFVNGRAVAKSEFLGWKGAPPEYAGLLLDTGFIDLGPRPRGDQNVRIQAEGQASGCSEEGLVASWGGSLRIRTS